MEELIRERKDHVNEVDGNVSGGFFLWGSFCEFPSRTYGFDSTRLKCKASLEVPRRSAAIKMLLRWCCQMYILKFSSLLCSLFYGSSK